METEKAKKQPDTSEPNHLEEIINSCRAIAKELGDPIKSNYTGWREARRFSRDTLFLEYVVGIDGTELIKLLHCHKTVLFYAKEMPADQGADAAADASIFDEHGIARHYKVEIQKKARGYKFNWQQRIHNYAKGLTVQQKPGLQS